MNKEELLVNTKEFQKHELCKLCVSRLIEEYEYTKSDLKELKCCICSYGEMFELDIALKDKNISIHIENKNKIGLKHTWHKGLFIGVCNYCNTDIYQIDNSICPNCKKEHKWR